MFGWGNNEYDQLNAVKGADEDMQVAVPRHLPFKGIGKVVKVASAGSMCALLNGKGKDRKVKEKVNREVEEEKRKS